MDRKFFDMADRTVVVEDEFGRSSQTLRKIDYVKFVPNERARVAMELVVRWGIVAAVQDGEDAAGRSKDKLQPPIEIVKRAVETADLLMEDIEKRGWMLPCPSPHEYYEESIEAPEGRKP